MRRKPAVHKPARIHRPSLAQRADRHALYQRAVQDPSWEIDFMADTFRVVRGRPAKRLREDFCGTALFACAWVKSASDREAVGVDLDGEVLAWSRERNVAKLTPAAARRLTLLQADVREVEAAPADIIAAFNFSYWIFRDRPGLLAYFKRVREGLEHDGVFMLDAYGGHDAFKVMRERQDFGRFTYIWDQADYDPVSGETTCYIHFAFPDGSRLNRAFNYHWRLWSLPELRELLAEAGFRASTVYWQGTDPKSGEGTDEFKPAKRGDADPAWIAYIVAEK